MVTVGSREWGATTGGALDLSARLRFARQAVLSQLAELPGRLLPGKTSALVTDREPPDSPLARKVLALAGSAYPAPLLGHCLRCWLWADLLAQLDGIDYDDELLYIACLLHDLALTEPHQAQCFTVHGGDVALSTLVSYGATESFAKDVAEAITLHMNVHVPTTLGREAHLLHDAAHLDVAGTRASALPREAIRQVVTKHPRDGFSACFTDLMRREARERPRSRAAVLWRLGMRLPISLNPLDRPKG